MDTYDIEIIQGATFQLGVTLTDASSNPIDLTNYNISGYLRFKFSDSSPLVSFNVEKIAPLASGIVNLSLPATGTAVLPITVARYDVELMQTGSGIVDKILLGTAIITPETTR